jgi:hypothetical protein
MSCNLKYVIALVAVLSATALADVPAQLPVQGRLTDSTGVPVDSGTVTFGFRILDAETGGSAIWPVAGEETQLIDIAAGGLWQAAVGSVLPLTGAVFADSVRWLEITVDTGTGPETLSRIRLLTAPYVFRADHALTSDVAALALDAQLLGGSSPVDFAAAVHMHSPDQIDPQGDASGLDADRLDGEEGDYYTTADHLTGLLPESVRSASHLARTDVSNVFAGHQTFPSAAFTTTVAPPFSVMSTDVVTNLNVDQLDGQDAVDFATAAHTHAPGEISPQGSGSGLDADLLDGQEASDFASDPHSHDGLWWANGANYFYNAGRVGIGTTSPEVMLHVAKGALSGAVPNSGTVGVFESDNIGYVSILTPDFAERGILFGEPSSAMAGGIIYNNQLTPGGMQFRTAFNVTGMALEASGRLSLGTSTGTGQLHINGISSNSTVILPQNSISNGEILDEPGIVADVNAAVVTLGSTTMQDIVTVTITTPAAGYILVEAKCNGLTHGTTGRNLGIVQIDRTSGGSATSPYFATFGLVGYANTTLANSFPVYVKRIYFETAGSYTFRLEAAENAGNFAGAVTRVGQSMITATFIPTSYGSVTTIVPADESIGFAGAQSSATGEGYRVDLRELEIRALRLRAEAERAEQTLARARRQMEQ